MSEVLAASMAWMDTLWDDDAALLWDVRRAFHMTRDSAWYALGLLQRRGPGDAGRAARAIDAVVATQHTREGTEFSGTFRRAPEEADPPEDPVMWIHYDPNWRWFIGTTFALLCDRYTDDLPGGHEERMREAIDRAVRGEPEGRVSAAYSNIALMKAWLEDWAGDTERAEAYAREVAGHFEAHGTFLEYNSPTYYGIDLFALALWRTSGSAVLRDLGARMEEALWRDAAAFYHAGLRNLCGPFDRAYGMDMCDHATPLGLYVWDVVGRERAPFPQTSGKFRHPHDLCFGPCVSAVAAEIPSGVAGHLSDFDGERSLERIVTDEPRRAVTAWLSDDVMLGAWTGPPSGIGFFQHHHATAHWRRPDGSVGWMRLRPETFADATASRGQLRIRSDGPIELEFHPWVETAGDRWSSDGLGFRAGTGAAVASQPEPNRVRLEGPVDLTLWVD